MNYTLPLSDRTRLRTLALKQAEIAKYPIMEERKKKWMDMNDNVSGSRPPVAIESWTFDRDFMPDNIFECTSEYGKRVENLLLRNIRHHEILGDDHVCPDTYDMNYHIQVNEFGMTIPTTYVKDGQGVTTGYHFECPYSDLTNGFDLIKPAEFSVDREGTKLEKQLLEETFGDILPVVLRSGTYGNNNLTQRLMRIISMENFFMAMYDTPEQVHKLMALLRDNSIRMSKWAEKEGLLVLNNGNQFTCGTCYNFTTLLPKNPVTPGQVPLNEMWSVMDSQETVGISPALFQELIFPYYKELAELFGFVYWGCCEPADPIWETSLSKLPNLKAVSISRWANQEYMADALTGKGIVFSRKPDPNLLGVDVVLNEEGWRKEIRSTLELTHKRDIPTEFVVRDVYTMHGNLGKARRAVELANEEIDKFYR